MRLATASSAMKAMNWSLPPQGMRHVRAGRVDVPERGPRKGLAPEPCGPGACDVAGCTGLEPVASGVTVSETGLAGIGRSVQSLAITQGEDGRDSRTSPGFGAFSRPRVTPGLQSQIVKSIPSERLLSVRQVAARLGVSTSTIYKLCSEGRLAHVRVANAIRLLPGGLPEERQA
jgi:excisionase family DNA binding protein